MPASLVAIPSITRISDRGNACILPNVVDVSPQPCLSIRLKASLPKALLPSGSRAKHALPSIVCV